jgi:hypothetical protein
MQPMKTLPQPKPLGEHLQVDVTLDAKVRIRAEAGRIGVSLGRLISDLAERYLPEVEIDAA